METLPPELWLAVADGDWRRLLRLRLVCRAGARAVPLWLAAAHCSWCAAAALPAGALRALALRESGGAPAPAGELVRAFRAAAGAARRWLAPRLLLAAEGHADWAAQAAAAELAPRAAAEAARRLPADLWAGEAAFLLGRLVAQRAAGHFVLPPALADGPWGGAPPEWLAWLRGAGPEPQWPPDLAAEVWARGRRAGAPPALALLTASGLQWVAAGFADRRQRPPPAWFDLALRRAVSARALLAAARHLPPSELWALAFCAAERGRWEAAAGLVRFHPRAEAGARQLLARAWACYHASAVERLGAPARVRALVRDPVPEFAQLLRRDCVAMARAVARSFPELRPQFGAAAATFLRNTPRPSLAAFAAAFRLARRAPACLDWEELAHGCGRLADPALITLVAGAAPRAFDWARPALRGFLASAPAWSPARRRFARELARLAAAAGAAPAAQCALALIAARAANA